MSWYCIDCRYPRDLDSHGRCETCNSEAILDLTLSPYNPLSENERIEENYGIEPQPLYRMQTIPARTLLARNDLSNVSQFWAAVRSQCSN